jgi:hypothetical protein
MEKINPKEMPRCPWGAILLYLTNISLDFIHMKKNELLVSNTKTQKHNYKSF